MAAVALKEQLASLMDSMYQEGLLDEQFQQLQSLQDETNPCFVMEVVTLFCDDAERIFGELDKIIVGAQNVKLACIQFRHSLEDNDREGCLRALNVVKREYLHLRSKLETMLQLEQRIQAYDKQKN
ncbi:Two-component phosphorelay intermediate involved in MAP kinase cascade regulation protein [Dioscorea alata]|uniref:Two-component phosphorelay intermediate involved in MAP kinase cascade regulation protein n=1 Tax=Dioscorea alata TaxID=55571 RepID=A0ACB7VCZ7_DIOAL|nr:Two-component phosphorelay intermediate involved in MAP kinase cascade regulation protein [Dioscorea alata]